MIKHFWTKFSASYPRTIVYMLQASSYRPKEYFGWLRRTKDFRGVIIRRELDYTIKAMLMLVIVWLSLVAFYLLAVVLVIRSITTASPAEVLVGVLLLILAPTLVAYWIAVPLWIGNKLIQTPHQCRIVANAKRVLAKHPGFKIAIAGSYGKTSAKEVLSTILAEGKKVAFTPGNMNTSIGISRFATTLKGDEEVIIFELGEEKVGDVRELCELINPELGIITGINEAHLSSFGTLERTASTIFELADYLGDKPVYKNQESPLVEQKLQNGDSLAYNRKGSNGWKVTSARTGINGTDFVIAKGEKKINAHTGLLGLHNVGIICASVAIADSIGLSFAQIESGIKNTVPYEHRMKPIKLHGAWLIDDTYNGNSEGVQAGLVLLKSLEAKRRIYVTPGLVEQGAKNREVHEAIGSQIAEVADVTVLMKNSVTNFIVSGLNDKGYTGKLMIIDSPLDFYTNLDQFVADGDVVLMQNDWPDNYV